MEDLSKKIAAIDITTTNRIAAARGSEIEFRYNDILTPGYKMYFKDEPKRPVTPNKLLFDNNNQRILVTTPQKNNLILCFDTETGANLGQVSTKINSLIDTPIDAVTPVTKFSNARPSDSVSLVATSCNSLFRVDWDPRTPEKHVEIGKNQIIINNSRVNFTSVATTGTGQLASGDDQGVVRLYSSPSVKFSRAKTSFTQLPDSVQAVDVSSNGEWVLWTTKTYIALINTLFESKDGSTVCGFNKPMGKNKSNALILRLKQDDMMRHGIEEVDFKGAKFDNGTYTNINDANIIEEEIVASTGPFIVRWKFRPVKLEYFKKRQGLECSVRPAIYRQTSVVVDKIFEYGKKALATAAEDNINVIFLKDEDDENVDEEDEDDDDYESS